MKRKTSEATSGKPIENFVIWVTFTTIVLQEQMHTTRKQATRAREKRTAPIIVKILSSKKSFFRNKPYNKLITCYVKSIWTLCVKPAITSSAVELWNSNN